MSFLFNNQANDYSQRKLFIEHQNQKKRISPPSNTQGQWEKLMEKTQNYELKQTHNRSQSQINIQNKLQKDKSPSKRVINPQYQDSQKIINPIKRQIRPQWMENYQVNADKAYDSIQQKYNQKRNHNPPKANLESKQDNVSQKRLVKALPDKNKDYYSQIDNLPGQIKSTNISRSTTPLNIQRQENNKENFNQLSKLHKKYDFESQIMNLPGYKYSKDKQALENDKSQTQLYKEKYYKRFQQSMGQEIVKPVKKIDKNVESLTSYVIGEHENHKKKQFQVNQGHKQNYQIKNSQRMQKNEAKGHIEQLREISKKIPNLRKY